MLHQNYLQQRFSLSEPAVEEALATVKRHAKRRFIEISIARSPMLMSSTHRTRPGTGTV